jgi:hypothetical protein
MNIQALPSQITSLVFSESLPGTGATELSKTIHLSFVPDIIQVSHVFYRAVSVDDAIHKITSNLINTEDGVIQSAFDGVQFSQPMIFSNNKPIDGTYTFNFSDGGLAEGVFSMSITFIKY